MPELADHDKLTVMCERVQHMANSVDRMDKRLERTEEQLVNLRIEARTHGAIAGILSTAVLMVAQHIVKLLFKG